MKFTICLANQQPGKSCMGYGGILARIGFSHIETDAEFGDRVYKEQDEFYMPDRMFRIAAFKE